MVLFPTTLVKHKTFILLDKTVNLYYRSVYEFKSDKLKPGKNLSKSYCKIKLNLFAATVITALSAGASEEKLSSKFPYVYYSFAMYVYL